jgi:osmotically inducible lipoprotein OsmB
MKTKFWAVAMIAVLGVASCGDTLGQQLLTGGGIGGVAAAATGGDVGTGIVVGAAAGAAFCQTYPNDPKC